MANNEAQSETAQINPTTESELTKEITKKLYQFNINDNLKNDSPFIYTQNTNLDSKKTTASNTTLKCGNNEINMTEKVNY